VWNLIENAAKYGAPPIVLAVGREDGWAVVTVTDAGHGIPVADRSRIMEPFYRGDAARTPSAGHEPSRGFGLGLSLARPIAMAHGGSLTLGPVTTTDGRETGCQATLRVAIAPATPPTLRA
jgi:signal transduction histidine kinase